MISNKCSGCPGPEGKTACADFTVEKDAQDSPAAPTKSTATVSSITLTEVPGCEYSLDGETWTDNPTFTGLEMNKEYCGNACIRSARLSLLFQGI